MVSPPSGRPSPARCLEWASTCTGSIPTNRSFGEVTCGSRRAHETERIYSQGDRCDVLYALNRETVEVHRSTLSEGGTLVLQSREVRGIGRRVTRPNTRARRSHARARTEIHHAVHPSERRGARSHMLPFGDIAQRSPDRSRRLLRKKDGRGRQLEPRCECRRISVCRIPCFGQ